MRTDARDVTFLFMLFRIMLMLRTASLRIAFVLGTLLAALPARAQWVKVTSSRSGYITCMDFNLSSVASQPLNNNFSIFL